MDQGQADLFLSLCLSFSPLERAGESTHGATVGHRRSVATEQER